MTLGDYALIDSGKGYKLERFGPYLIARPCAQAVWNPRLSADAWHAADAFFSREGGNKWSMRHPLPSEWQITIDHLTFKLALTDFGHLGLFPEQRPFWQWIEKKVHQWPNTRPPRLLNLFAYSGGASLAAAKGGAEVCHLDASKGMVSWARENAGRSGLGKAPIRWIVEDVKKFLSREMKRGARYDAIVLDPPTFGRGTKGELFKIEEEIVGLLETCRCLLSETPLFILFSCHTPGFSPLVMHHLMAQAMGPHHGFIETGELTLCGTQEVWPLPSGTYATWEGRRD